MKTYNSFIDLFEKSIKPLTKENPEWIRLDGEIKGGNRQVFGKFKYNNKVWKINSDSHIEKLKNCISIFNER